MGGGGTDLPSYYQQHEGFLLAAAINKYVFIVINKRFQESIRLSYSKTEIVHDVKEIEHNIFRESLKLANVTKQVELASLADVPANCGLGTSSSFAVSLIGGLSQYSRQYLSLDEIAERACNVEIDILKAPIGKQDQYAAAFGGFNAYWFHRNGSVTVEALNIREEVLNELENNLLLFYLESNRSASSVLEAQDRKSKEGDTATLNRLHKIKEMGLYTKKILENGKVHEFGEILHEHWLTKRGLSESVSTSFIDEVYEIARQNGAVGGKIVGAGGGGFLMLYCPGEKSRLVSSMRHMGLSPMWFTFEMSGLTVVYQH
jgi:D-glycero-alpha-D-manno-heptose-7-phosphate kinase